jgi:hypothetical protein
MDPETQYLRNQPPNQFLYFMKSCMELRKPRTEQGSQAKIIIFKGRKLSLKLGTVIVIKMHFWGLSCIGNFQFLGFSFQIIRNMHLFLKF